MYNNNNINLPSFLNADSLILSENSETRRKKKCSTQGMLIHLHNSSNTVPCPSYFWLFFFGKYFSLS